MREDLLVEEARRAGQKYIESFRGDAASMLEDLRRRSEAAGRKAVSLPPRPVRHPSARPKKAG